MPQKYLDKVKRIIDAQRRMREANYYPASPRIDNFKFRGVPYEMRIDSRGVNPKEYYVKVEGDDNGLGYIDTWLPNPRGNGAYPLYRNHPAGVNNEIARRMNESQSLVDYATSRPNRADIPDDYRRSVGRDVARQIAENRMVQPNESVGGYGVNFTPTNVNPNAAASRFMRRCTNCGRPMDSGYVIGGGDEYYCGDGCLNTRYSPEQYNRMYRANDDENYWTEFDD